MATADMACSRPDPARRQWQSPAGLPESRRIDQAHNSIMIQPPRKPVSNPIRVPMVIAMIRLKADQQRNPPTHSRRRGCAARSRVPRTCPGLPSG